MPARRRRDPRVLSAGYVTLDLVARDIGSGDLWQSIGGTCGNVSAFASALGARVTILTRVGHDRRGRYLLASLRAADVDVSDVECISDLRTPGVVEFLRTDELGGHRFAFLCPVCGTKLPKATVVSTRQARAMSERVEEFDAFFFDRASSATIRLAEAARDAGLLVVFEPTTVPRTDAAERAAAISDIVKVSKQPSNRMGAWRPRPGASTRFIIETLGSLGTRLRSRKKDRWGDWRLVPCTPQTRVYDAAGAGDWLTAGLLASLLSQPCTPTEYAVHAAIEYGQRLSGLSLWFDGAQGALTALGSATIKQIASENSPIGVPPDVIGLPPQRNHREPQMAGCCELCLTELSAAS